MDKRLIMGQAT